MNCGLIVYSYGASPRIRHPKELWENAGWNLKEKCATRCMRKEDTGISGFSPFWRANMQDEEVFLSVARGYDIWYWSQYSRDDIWWMFEFDREGVPFLWMQIKNAIWYLYIPVHLYIIIIVGGVIPSMTIMDRRNTLLLALLSSRPRCVVCSVILSV